jgi:DNA modification methylase
MPGPEDLKLERVAISDLHPDPANARHHSNKNLRSIEGSLKRFGQQAPIVVDEHGVVVAGNGRLVAAEKLGWTHLWVIRTTLGEVDRVAYALADNRTSELATWDPEALAVHLGALQDVDFDLGEIGWDEKDLKLALPGDPLEDDEIPDPPAEPETKPGDLIILGRHRLKCGDSTSADDVADALGGAEPFLMVTDPPYGVEYDPGWRVEAEKKGYLKGERKNARSGQVSNDDRADWRDAWSLFPGMVAYVWHAAVNAPTVHDSLTACAFEIRSQIIWRKQAAAISRSHYHWGHEPCWYSVRKGATAKWAGDRKQSTIWDAARPGAQFEDKTPHGTQKPVEIMARPIRNHGGPEDHVYDPFLGSGTTLIAAEKLGRRCFGLEIFPAYCDVIVQRWEKATGQKAERP